VSDGAPAVFTLGHSTRTLDEFLDLAAEQGIRHLVDVRRYPGSRRYAHFAREVIAAGAAARAMSYEHVPELGGRREGAAGSRNRAWRNPSFRAYADHAGTAEFRTALDGILAADLAPLALFCAEAVPWRCHRRIIADALVGRGVPVRHILAPGRVEIHELHPDARVLPDETVIYPGAGDLQMDLLG
jgi:uncharacterized protein (DUF488 family)